jgi:hypothetical protein
VSQTWTISLASASSHPVSIRDSSQSCAFCRSCVPRRRREARSISTLERVDGSFVEAEAEAAEALRGWRWRGRGREGGACGRRKGLTGQGRERRRRGRRVARRRRGRGDMVVAVVCVDRAGLSSYLGI